MVCMLCMSDPCSCTASTPKPKPAAKANLQPKVESPLRAMRAAQTSRQAEQEAKQDANTLDVHTESAVKTLYRNGLITYAELQRVLPGCYESDNPAARIAECKRANLKRRR